MHHKVNMSALCFKIVNKTETSWNYKVWAKKWPLQFLIKLSENACLVVLDLSVTHDIVSHKDIIYYTIIKHFIN